MHQKVGLNFTAATSAPNPAAMTVGNINYMAEVTGSHTTFSGRFQAKTDSDAAPDAPKGSAGFADPTPLVQRAWFLRLRWLVTRAIVLPIHRLLANFDKFGMDVRLQERQRIALELHDTLIQSAQGLIFCFQGIAGELPESAPMRTKMESALDQADNLLREARDRVYDLRISSLDGDLTRALSRTAHALMLTESVGFDVTSNGEPRLLIQDIADDIFRIGKEALTNAFVHASAKNIHLQTMYTATEFMLLIRDDGRGIESRIMHTGSRPHHFGLQGMRERAERIGALLNIRSREGVGTEIELRVAAPLAYGTAPIIRPCLKLLRLLLPARIRAPATHKEEQPIRSAVPSIWP